MDDFNEFDNLDTDDTLRTMLTIAVQLGGSVYNTGDHRGCYEIYAATGRMLLQLMEVPDDYKPILSEALQEASLNLDVSAQAWTMRRAFDSILAE